MSFKILVVDGTNQCIHAMADKRSGWGYFDNGVRVDWKFNTDDNLKIQRLAPNIYFMGGGFGDISNNLFRSLDGMSDEPASMIIEKAKLFNRRILPPFGCEYSHDDAYIFGLYDNGELFIWNAECDGTEGLRFVNKSWLVQMKGGIIEDTQESARVYFLERLKILHRFPQAMAETLLYTASIDKVISPTYDYIRIDATNKTTMEILNINGEVLS